MSLFAQPFLDVHDELIVDLFAGGGGASSGIEQATGRMVDIAINHNETAVSLHKANHPQTRHYVSDVFEVCPRKVTEGRPVGLIWASPDCTFHSKARGSKPIRHATKKRRALAWVVTRWAGQVRPRVIILENVEEFQDWGPLVGERDSLRPCKKRRGKTFKRWVRSLKQYGYTVEWKELRACDYGAPTIRKRLFLIARCDGQPIVWPEATHGPGRKPYRTAADCIDWKIPMCSIFATKEEAKEWAKSHGQAAPVRPLASNTLSRIARGVKKFVLDNPKPFLVTITHSCGRWGTTEKDLSKPLEAITAKNEWAVVAANLIDYHSETGPDARASGLGRPLETIDTSNRHGLVASFLTQNNGGFYDGAGHELEKPMSTVLANGTGHHGLISAHIQRDFGTSTGHKVDQPLGTITCEGGGKAGLVCSFLSQYNGTGIGQEVSNPLNTITSKDRQGLVSVLIDKARYVVADIFMRMLQPRELYRAQGFRDSYIIDRGHDGRPITKTEQVKMCGNSVSPVLAESLVFANCADLIVRKRVA